MKKFALAILVLAFGGMMIAGCPKDEGKKTDGGDKKCAPKDGDAKEGDAKEGDAKEGEEKK